MNSHLQVRHNIMKPHNIFNQLRFPGLMRTGIGRSGKTGNVLQQLFFLIGFSEICVVAAAFRQFRLGAAVVAKASEKQPLTFPVKLYGVGNLSLRVFLGGN